ncbi:hypothetical protein LTR97_012162 [Elasticomyces elasticus]|uniref:Uncharacterized protein n=1 Tax=Elasticomyces elasticus TaxID=574655 RepID=A0AAN7ZY89_9PEZI|nr:hypothetical protein LTR97_012162 [Elasticomyces elasticus]
MAPTAPNTAASRHVSADPKEGLWTLEYLTLLYLLYTRFAFAIPTKRSQHVIAIFKKIFRFDLLIKHPSPSRTLADRHIPDKYLFRNKAGRGGKFKEVEADPKSLEQQARVDKIMPLIRSAITDLGFQNAVSEAQVTDAEDDEEDDEVDEADKEADEGEDGSDVEEGGREVENTEVNDDGDGGQSRRDTRLPRGTKRKHSLDLAQPGSASKKSRAASSGAAFAVEKAASEKAEGADDEVGQEVQLPTTLRDDDTGLTVARSSRRRTTQSSRLKQAIADGGSEVIGIESNAAAAAVSTDVGPSPASSTKQKDVKKASRAKSTSNGPVPEQRKGRKSSLGNSGTVLYPIDEDAEAENVLQMISADKTPNLLKMMQKKKLSGDLAKSSNVVGLSKHLYKMDNPLATPADIAADWQETERQMFNQWTVQQPSSRLAGGNGGVSSQELEKHQDKAQSKDLSSIDLNSMPDSPSSTSNEMYSSAQPIATPPTYGHRVEKPTNAFLLRPFYGPKPHTASSVGHAGVGVQAGGEATSAEGDELLNKLNSSGKNNDSA